MNLILAVLKNRLLRSNSQLLTFTRSEVLGFVTHVEQHLRTSTAVDQSEPAKLLAAVAATLGVPEGTATVDHAKQVVDLCNARGTEIDTLVAHIDALSAQVQALEEALTGPSVQGTVESAAVLDPKVNPQAA